MALAGVVATAATTGVLLALAADAWSSVASPAPWRPDDLLLAVLAGAGAGLALWLGVGFVVAALAALPGLVGRRRAALSRQVAPALVRRLAGVGLGTALVAGGLAPIAATAVPLGDTAGRLTTTASTSAPGTPSAATSHTSAASAASAASPVTITATTTPTVHPRDDVAAPSPDLVPPPPPPTSNGAGSGSTTTATTGRDRAAATSGPPTDGRLVRVGASTPSAEPSGSRPSSPAATLGPLAPAPARDLETAQVRKLLPPPESGEPALAPSAATPVRVAPGDSLWTLAVRAVGPGATVAAVTAEWHRWYVANRLVIGADPDRLLPGQLLRPPPAAAVARDATTPAGTKSAGPTP